jgi:hypothetical protein
MRRRGGAATLLAILALACAAAASPLAPGDVPNPAADPAACHRGPAPSWICDAAGALSTAGGDEVEGVLRDVASARPPYARAACAPSSGRPVPGHQVAVAVVPAMKLKQGEEPAAGAERFARALMAAWRVGAAGCDDGVLIFLSVSDRQVGETGGGEVREGALG